MKLILGLIGILLGVALADDVSGKPQSYIKRVDSNKLRENCVKTSGMDLETVEKVDMGAIEYPETDEMKAYTKCLMKGMGFIDDDGKIIIDAKKLVSVKVVISEEKAEEIVKKCNIQKESSEETAFQLDKCLHAELKNFRRRAFVSNGENNAENYGQNNRENNGDNNNNNNDNRENNDDKQPQS